MIEGESTYCEVGLTLLSGSKFLDCLLQASGVEQDGELRVEGGLQARQGRQLTDFEGTAPNLFAVERLHGGFGVFLFFVVDEGVQALEQKRHTAPQKVRSHG